MSKLWNHLTDWKKSPVYSFMQEFGIELKIWMNLFRLKNTDAYSKLKAAEELVKMGDPAAVSALIVALKDKSQYVRSIAAEALGRIGDLSAIPELIVALKDDCSVVRNRAAEALGKIGKPAVAALIEALGDKRWSIRVGAAEASGKIGPRNYKDLLLLRSAAREARKEGNDTTQLLEVYNRWSKPLKGRADEIVEKKKLPKPKPGNPGSVKRVERMQRVSM